MRRRVSTSSIAAKSSLPGTSSDLEPAVLRLLRAGRPRSPPSSRRSRCPGCGSCRSTRCASGASGRPRCSCSSFSARARLLWSEARRSRCRVNSSLALRVTVSCSSRLSPRCGNPDGDVGLSLLGEPPFVERRVVGLDRHQHLLGHARAAARRSTGPRGWCRPARPAVRSSTLSMMKPLRPTTRPLRTKNTCTAASSSSSAMPITSMSSAVGHHLLLLDGLAHRW